MGWSDNRHRFGRTGICLPILPASVVTANYGKYSECDQRDLLPSDKAIDCGDERLAHGVHQCRGREQLSTMEAEEQGRSAVGLESRLIHVEVHSVDAFHFQSHMALEDFGD